MLNKVLKIMIICLVFIGFVVGCGKKDSKNGEVFSKYKQYYIKISNLDNFIDMYKSKTTYVTVISQTTCTHCIDYKEVLNRVAFDEKVDIYVLEFNLLSNEDKIRFQNLNSRFKSFGTPLTIFTRSGEIVDEMVGNLGSEKLIAKLTSNGLIGAIK